MPQCLCISWSDMTCRQLCCRHASPQVLHRPLGEALLCSHVHPGDIEYAYIQAAAIAPVCTCARCPSIKLHATICERPPRMLQCVCIKLHERTSRRLCCRHASPQVLRKAVEDALLCSHVHPEGIEGAYIQAAAVAALCTRTSPTLQGTCAASTPRQLLSLPSAHAPAQRHKVFVLLLHPGSCCCCPLYMR